MVDRTPFTKLGNSIEASRAAGFELLLTDVQLAHTLLQRVALTADGATRKRNIERAAHARDTIQRLMKRLDLDADRQSQLEEGVRSLEVRLARCRSREP